MVDAPPGHRRSGMRRQRESGTLGGGIMGTSSALAADGDDEHNTVVRCRDGQANEFNAMVLQVGRSVVVPDDDETPTDVRSAGNFAGLELGR
jgi:hypothetical protein